MKKIGELATSQFETLLPKAGSAAIQKAITKITGDSISNNDIFGSISGAVLNPNVELLFDSIDMRNFNLKFKQKLTAKKIFSNYRKNEMNAKEFITNFKEKLARSLIIIITTIDPDAIVFGGGISNEIDFLDEIKILTSKLINEPNLKTVFLKPLYGDASGVRGAALLGRENFI